MSERGGGLPDLNYFLNNGREDITREELVELLTVIAKASFEEKAPKGCDGAALPSFAPEVEIESMEESPEPFPGFGEGGSLQDYGLEGFVVSPSPSNETLFDETEPERRSGCEGRRRYGTRYFDYEDEGDEAEHPDDYGYW